MAVLWIVLTVALACLGGWPVTAGVLRLAKSHSVRAVDAHERGDADGDLESGPDAVPGMTPSPAPEAAPSAETRSVAGVLRGGLLIGVLERAAVVFVILVDQPVAIAYVVAIKGLGRYPELKETPAASERFIIGTLASMLWAAVIAAVVKVLLL
ncbi:hypothetical protein [Specibacter sp. RAF43]|uniref:hypothetical protein n=1 Tax=Specibacter sp. RAF43 TaxID=3233057 RepID=UPI003F993958